MTDQNCILLWPFFIESANLTLSIFYCLVYLTMPNLRVFPLYSSQSIQIYRMNISDCEGREASWFENIAISYYNHLVFILICWCHFYSVYSSENKRRRNLRCFQNTWLGLMLLIKMTAASRMNMASCDNVLIFIFYSQCIIRNVFTASSVANFKRSNL